MAARCTTPAAAMHHFGGMGAPWCRCRTSGGGVCFARSGCRITNGQGAVLARRTHWTRIRTNNVIERLNREIRRRTRVVGSFPDGNSALMLVCARLRHVAGTQWGNKKYMNMKHLEAAIEDVSIAG